MSAYAVHEISFDLPASSVTRANGGFSEADQDDVIGRWVERGTGNTVVLVADGESPLGVITRITNDKVAVAVGPVVKGKRGINTAIANGSKVTGATRQESASGSPERGFVKNADLTNTASAAKSRGYVVDGGATSGPGSTNNTPAAMCEVLLY